MKRNILVALLALGLFNCSTIKPHEKTAQEQASREGLSIVPKSRFDSTFVSSTMRFEQYKKIKVDNLDFSNVKIIKPVAQSNFNQTWELNDEDKRYYQAKYSEAIKKNLFATGLYTEVNEAGADTLLLVAKIIQIAPLAPKDDFKNRPNLVDIYSEGFGRMTIGFEVYDSTTKKLLLSATDEHDLGRIWEKNNRAQNNVQIRLAFEYWADNLKTELEHAAKR